MPVGVSFWLKELRIDILLISEIEYNIYYFVIRIGVDDVVQIIFSPALHKDVNQGPYKWLRGML